MKNPLQSLLTLSVLSLLAFVPSSLATASVEMNIPPGNYAHQLGTRALKDPSGAEHSRQEVAGKVVVGIFTAPNMSQGDTQEKWSKILADDPATKLSEEVSLILVEDMSQAGMFKGIARSDMKKEFTPNSRPFLILDENGDVLKKFGVDRNKTEILIYDKKGKLRDVETDLSNQDLVAHRVKEISKKLMAE